MNQCSVSRKQTMLMEIFFGRCWNTVNEWSCLRRVLIMCEESPKRTRVLFSQSSKLKIVLATWFHTPLRCSKEEWISFWFPIILLLFRWYFFQAKVVLVTGYTMCYTTLTPGNPFCPVTVYSLNSCELCPRDLSLTLRILSEYTLSYALNKSSS